MDKITIKSSKLRATFIQQDSYFTSDVFGRVLAFVQKHPRQCRLKEHGNKPSLIIENILSVDEALVLLKPLTGQTGAAN
jgi:transcription-repair coupling factor (superfamily II helicase)